MCNIPELVLCSLLRLAQDLDLAPFSIILYHLSIRVPSVGPEGRDQPIIPICYFFFLTWIEENGWVKCTYSRMLNPMPLIGDLGSNTFLCQGGITPHTQCHLNRSRLWMASRGQYCSLWCWLVSWTPVHLLFFQCLRMPSTNSANWPVGICYTQKYAHVN